MTEASAADLTLVQFDGPRLLDGDGVLIAEMAADGQWYTGDGVRCSGLTLPAARVRPRVSKRDRDEARRAADRQWMKEAHGALCSLARSKPEITSDDVWAALAMPPRESRMIGNALAAAGAARLFEPTDAHRPSTRPENHGRPVRVWRSLRLGQQQIC